MLNAPKYDPKAYDVKVMLPNGHLASLIVVTYNLDVGREFVGLEFYRLVYTPEETGSVPDPGYEPFTFQQELRLLSSAAATYKGPRATEQKVIDAKMKEAYGDKAAITIIPFKP